MIPYVNLSYIQYMFNVPLIYKKTTQENIRSTIFWDVSNMRFSSKLTHTCTFFPLSPERRVTGHRAQHGQLLSWEVNWLRWAIFENWCVTHFWARMTFPPTVFSEWFLLFVSEHITVGQRRRGHRADGIPVCSLCPPGPLQPGVGLRGWCLLRVAQLRSSYCPSPRTESLTSILHTLSASALAAGLFLLRPSMSQGSKKTLVQWAPKCSSRPGASGTGYPIAKGV